MLDRFFRGFVVDFIDFSVWPAFNLADAAISLSAIGLIIYFWKK
jgi:signal peptidase II